MGSPSAFSQKIIANYWWDKNKVLPLHGIKEESWQSDRMRWTRNPVYPFTGIGGLNPSLSARNETGTNWLPFYFVL